MKYTGNLNLKKPEGTDIVNINDLNENADILDLAVAGKVDKVAGKGLSDENFTAAEKNKLAGIATGANNYTHPANHPASIITQDVSNRFVTDTEKANWNAKETPAGAQNKVDTHANNTTSAHGATSAATANKIMIRDAFGRAKVAAPSAADDIARKAEVDAVQTNLNAHLADYVRQPGYAIDTGTANTYAVSLDPAPTAYVDGMALSVKINTDNTGASTINVNGLGGKAIKKPNGNDVSAGNLKAGSIYPLRYNGTNFILQGSDAAGNATPADVLSGKTFTNDAGEATGTMPNRGGAITVTPGTSDQVKLAGYYSGNITIKGDANLVAGNIKRDASIFGVNGTMIPSDGSAVIYSDGINKCFVEGYSSGRSECSLEMLSDSIKLGVSKTSPNEIGIVTDKPYDLTGVQYIYIDCQTPSSIDSNAFLVVSPNKMGTSYDVTKYVTVGSTTRTTIKLSVADLTGMFYIRVHIRKRSMGAATFDYLNVYKVYII